MIKSIFIGILYSLTLLLSGWVRVLLSTISLSLGNRTPTLYAIVGISFGMGTAFGHLPFYPGFLIGIVLTVGIMYKASGIALKTGVQNTVSESCAGFIIGSVIGIIIGIF